MCERTIVSKNTKNCDMCGETFTPVSENNRFCNSKCRVRWWSKSTNGITKRKTTKRRCLACGTAYMGRKGQKFCSVTCSSTNINTPKWTENEIIYLASINAGYGFRRFVAKLWVSDEKFRALVLSIFDSFKEKTGVDYYEILQDPSKMELTGKWTRRNHRWPFTEYTTSYGGNKTDKHLQFNWGTFADDPRAEHGGE